VETSPRRSRRPLILGILAAVVVLVVVVIAIGAASNSATTPPAAAGVGRTSTSTSSATPAAANWAAAAREARAANDAYLRAWRDGQNAFGTPGFASWYQDRQRDDRCNLSRIKADQMLGGPTVDDTPLVHWFEDCTELQSHINEWGAAAARATGNRPTTDMNEFASKINADLATVGRDVLAFK